MTFHESDFKEEKIKQPPYDPWFGDCFKGMIDNLSPGGSELGLGMTLFSLTVSTRATRVLEIGRFKGFSTYAFAAAMRFLEMGWNEPEQHCQREYGPHMKHFLYPHNAVISIDTMDSTHACEVVEMNGLGKYVTFLRMDSQAREVDHHNSYDIIFIDGDHTYEGVKRDWIKYTPVLRRGGLVILHDYYGWFNENGDNGSPIAAFAEELKYQRILIDTFHQSFLIFQLD